MLADRKPPRLAARWLSEKVNNLAAVLKAFSVPDTHFPDVPSPRTLLEESQNVKIYVVTSNLHWLYWATCVDRGVI